MAIPTRVRWTQRAVAMTAVAAMAGLAACSSGDSGGSGGSGGTEGVTIRLAGPNQWNSNTKTFGPFWDTLTANFKKETGITVQTTVLPISEFSQTISTQLAAGTAPELVFNQPPHEPYMVVPLDDYMKKPNPFIPGNKTWYDAFNHKYFGYDAGSVNAEGKLEWVPFNLIGLGVFYNKAAFKKAGVEAPLKTYDDYINACGKLKGAGYAGFAMDNSTQGQGQVTNFIWNMLMSKYFDKLNKYAGNGDAGTAAVLTGKSQARAILTGEVDATKTPEVGETLKLVKGFMDACATPNWSGVPSSSGGFVNTADFVGQKAAMALGSNLAAANGVLKFDYGTMPFGTVTKATTALSTDFAAQSGLSAGGTSYMISSTTKDAKLDAAVKFLQYVSSPKGAQPFLDASGGLPAIEGAKPAPGLEGITSDKAWSQPLLMGAVPGAPKAQAKTPLFEGYLIGAESLDQSLADVQKKWTAGAKEAAKDGKWTDDWAKQ